MKIYSIAKFIFAMASLLLFSCGKSEIKAKNPASTPSKQASEQGTVVSPPGNTPDLPSQNQPVIPPESPVVSTTENDQVVLESETLKLSKTAQPMVLNKLESIGLKRKLKLRKQFTFKSSQDLQLNFKSGQQGVGYSQCESLGKPEVTVNLNQAGQESSSKFADLNQLELKKDQDFSIEVTIDNSIKCEILSFEFSIIAVVSEKPVEPPPVINPPIENLFVVTTAEFLSAGSFGVCVDLSCFTKDHRSSTVKMINPANKSEEIIEDRFVITPAIELICKNRHDIKDSSGIMNSICSLQLNPTLSTPAIKIYRGEGKQSNIVGVDIKDTSILEKICGKWPTINSDDKVVIDVDDSTKKEIPRLELSCTYDKNQKPVLATFIGVLN